MAIGYETIGKGPKRVLVMHGWFGDHTMFDPMRPSLSQDDFTYVLMDYRGYGKSKGEKGNYSMAEVSSDALKLADQLKWDKFNLIGHSMGGMAVQRILADAPQRVEKMVCVTPVPASGVPFEGDMLKLFESATNSMDARKGIISFSVGGKLSNTWVDHMARVSDQTSTKDAFGAYFKAWSGTNFVDAIKGKTLPVKVIVGANDGALTPDVMKATYMQWYPNAQLEVMQNAGHYPMDETPVALATSIENFLRQ
jgi:pimeloyl-ACP methyl ester carboxylesterase